MGLKAAVQALKKAEELKARVSRYDDLLNNSEVWNDQQQLQTVYHQVLVLDLEYALDKKVEQELWTLGFKNHIAALQHLSRDKKNPKRSEYQALLSWCLEAASGFYLTLLQELCSAFELDLPFRRRGAIYGQTKSLGTLSNNVNISTSEQFTQPHKSSCLYICQYCLVHLGDIARYRSQRKQAESFYRHAILLSPSSGQPYNQLALLEASRGDKLATVFHYVRSISVKYPFPAAATNLSNTLSAVIEQGKPLTEMHSKLSLTEFIEFFLRVHGLLHLASDLDQAELCIRSLNATFTALVATNAFSSIKLIQMTAINLYTLRHVLDSYSHENLSREELQVKNLTLDLLAGAFSAYLLPIYTMSSDSTLLDYYALPAIKLTLDWIKIDPSVLKENVFTKRLQIWPSLCKLLNNLQSINGYMEIKNSDKIPLPEDRDLQCFLPLVTIYKDLDFTISLNPNQDVTFFNKLRVLRLMNLSIWLAKQSINNNILITAEKIINSNKVLFEPSVKQPDPTTELLEELKHFNIKEDVINVTKEVQKSPGKSLNEKRGGILKPQGSLEKAREEREQQVLNLSTIDISENCNNNTLLLSNNSSLSGSSRGSVSNVQIIDTCKLKRNRQNIAMQTIAKKIVEENNKQVTFVTEPIIKNNETKFLQSGLNNTTMYMGNNKVHKNISLENNVYLKIPENMNDIQQQQQQQQLITNSFSNQMQQQLSYKPNMSFQNNSVLSNSLFPMPPNYAINTFTHSDIQPQSSTTASHNTRQYKSAFDITNLPPAQQQSYHSLAATQQQSEQLFQTTSWLHDDNKLPMPPSTWTSWPQKTLSHQMQKSSMPQQSNVADLLHHSKRQNYPFQATSNSTIGKTEAINNFLQDNISPSLANHNLNDSNIISRHQHNNIVTPTTINANNNNTVYNNTMSLWNTGPNLQMIFNHQASSNIKPTNISHISFNDSIMPIKNDIQSQKEINAPIPSGGYSLFNSNWGPNLAVHSTLRGSSPPDKPQPLIRQQSLFSGPGPSPLERLLLQQKQQRGGPSTLKEDT